MPLCSIGVAKRLRQAFCELTALAAKKNYKNPACLPRHGQSNTNGGSATSASHGSCDGHRCFHAATMPYFQQQRVRPANSTRHPLSSFLPSFLPQHVTRPPAHMGVRMRSSRCETSTWDTPPTLGKLLHPVCGDVNVCDRTSPKLRERRAERTRHTEHHTGEVVCALLRGAHR